MAKLSAYFAGIWSEFCDLHAELDEIFIFRRLCELSVLESMFLTAICGMILLVV